MSLSLPLSPTCSMRDSATLCATPDTKWRFSSLKMESSLAWRARRRSVSAPPTVSAMSASDSSDSCLPF